MLLLALVPLTLGTEPIHELLMEPLPTLSGSFTYHSTYSLTTNEDDQAIFAQLLTPLPEGCHLTVQVEAPTGATSLGTVSLSEEPTPLVLKISRVAEEHLRITYTFSCAKTTPTGLYFHNIKFHLANSGCK